MSFSFSEASRVTESRRTLTVVKRYEPAERVVALELSDPEGDDLPDWSPGAHIDLLLPDDVSRQYSLCSSPADRGSYRVAVLLESEGRGGSRHIHASVNEGDTVEVRGPRNHFSLDRATRYQFIGGGIGITPLIPMIESVEAEGARWQLTYGGRSRSSMAFVDELEAYGDRVTIWPEDDRGLIDLAALLGEPDDATLVYCCGPGALLDAVERACGAWPSGALHIERFSAREVADDDRGLDTFDVVCQRSGVTLTVPADKSILEVLEDEGLNVMGSCYEGTCGTCEVEVLEGEIAHRDSVLDDEAWAANDVMMTCVSRSRSERLVLDL